MSIPGNNKPLGSLQRAFVVVAETHRREPTFRLPIDNQPIGGQAIVSAFDPLPTLDVPVPAFSSVARSVFVTSSDENARVSVSVVETAPNPGGLTGQVLLNPDPGSPRLQNPRLQNPRLQNILVAEAYNPAITSSVVGNPRLQNPRFRIPGSESPAANRRSSNPRCRTKASIVPAATTPW